MKIATAPDFFDILKGKHLLLDTSVFIDASIHETEFAGLFNKLRDNNTTLVTIALVLFEFLKGAPDIARFKAKKTSVEKIIDAYLPLQISIEKDFSDLTEYETLINQYKIEGASVSVTDLLIGQQLLHFPNKLFLLTKNATDFPTNIFNLATYLNLLHRKAIQSYGVYNFTK